MSAKTTCKQEQGHDGEVKVKTLGAKADDHRLFKMACVKLDLDMRDAFTQASREWIARYAPEVLKEETSRKKQAA